MVKRVHRIDMHRHCGIKDHCFYAEQKSQHAQAHRICKMVKYGLKADKNQKT